MSCKYHGNIDENYRPCDCSGPGFCSRHNMQKGQKLYNICKNQCKYRYAFDEMTAGRWSPPQIKVSQSMTKIMNNPGEAQMNDKEAVDKVLEEVEAEGISLQNVSPDTVGLGDIFEKALSKVGITKEKAQEAIKGECGCSKRKKFLNTILNFSKKD